VTETWLRRLWR